MINPNKKRLRRSMMFLNAQKPSLIKDPYIYQPDSLMLDLEDAVAENQKDIARFSLFHALRTIDYRGCETVVRINGLDTDLWREDIRCAVAGGCDSIRIPKTESGKVQKVGPTIKPLMNNEESKLVKDIHEALIKCEAHDGMTISFHHHFREGDLIVNMVMEEIHKMGIKNITLSASSLGKAHDPLVPMIEDGTITNIESSGVRGKIGEAISAGKLKGLAIMRSHGGRVRAIVTGETHVDIAFIGTPTCDDYGNCRG